MFLLKSIVMFCLLCSFVSCATKKTKNDCVFECKERGAEYTGMTPNGSSSGQYGEFTEDVCHCR